MQFIELAYCPAELDNQDVYCQNRHKIYDSRQNVQLSQILLILTVKIYIHLKFD